MLFQECHWRRPGLPEPIHSSSIHAQLIVPGLPEPIHSSSIHAQFIVPGLPEPMHVSSIHTLLYDQPFKLTKFVNGYVSQESISFRAFLRFQPNLESLELHSGKMDVSKRILFLRHLNTLGCPSQFLDESYNLTRLRLDFEDSTDGECEIDVLRRLLKRNLTGNTKSLAMFFGQSQTHFPEIIRTIAVSRIYIQHLEIHQFLPTQVRS